MSVVYFLTYAAPRPFLIDGTPRHLLHARVSGIAHRDERAARRELAALSARHAEPLGISRVETFGDERAPRTRRRAASLHKEAAR
ncbi:hypothetical protein EV683_1179 [Crenobacter luteus]|uniref:hypothetical protein n=1 Tax=Crenobacter luteus TaxID=1452487 RepID=UPI001046F85A|nr:hypothetical protein [Crenobacter luteus]TCP10892.1 hypothetical protein EV683_1179 [Crenobacter luteus]